RSPDRPSEIVDPRGPGSADLAAYRLLRHQEPDRIAKETFEGSKWLGPSAIEVRGIHHRASHSFRTTKETLPNFRQKSKEI
ncbi:hypothetical protein Prudu_595S000300, partial [Prunus dulcis]